MKSIITVIAIITVSLLETAGTHAQQSKNEVVASIIASYSQRSYTTAPVTDDQIKQIVACGLKAPSARNLQPWMFTVVRNAELARRIMPQITEGNILIVVSGEGASTGVHFDCGLASQNMFVAAQALGLGARMYGSPAGNINNTMKDDLGIPETHAAIIVLRVGNVDKSVDAVSSASTRKPPESIVIFK